MPDLKNDTKRRPLKNLPPDRFPLKVSLIWLSILAAVLLLYYFNPARSTAPAQLKIQQVIELASEGKVESGVIRYDSSYGLRNGAVITGKVKEATLDAENGVKTAEFRAAGSLTEANLESLQRTKVFEEPPVSNTVSSLLLNFLPILLIIALLYFLFVRQIRQAGRGAMNFGKSRAKMLARDRDKITFGEVAGCDEAKEEVSEVVEFLKDPKKFQKMGGKIPKGLLLVGPPGTGKTLLAKAVAGEADVPFFSISGSDFVEMFVGVGASRVRDMFEQGRKNAPCIIFIDEIDAVGRQRGAGLGGGNDEREQTLNSMLVEMDGFDTTEGVIIIAATNRADVLDQALLRPGRFDRQVYVDLPDLVGREQILRVHARKITLSDDVNLNVIARGTPGLSGADLANLLNEAALLAARRNKKKVEMIDVDDAREKVQFGRERRRAMDEGEKKLTAYHEAGHALVTAVLDDGLLPVHKVTIIPRGGSLGSTMYIPSKDILTQEKKRLEIRIAIGCAGRIAEELVLQDISNGASGDIRQVTKIARHMVCDWGMSPLGMVAYGESNDTVFLGREITRNQHYSEETARKIDAEITRIISEQYTRATEIISTHRHALDKIAEALLEYETIEGKHVMEILKTGAISSPVVRELPPALPLRGDDKSVRKSRDTSEGIGGAPAPSPA
jgi:cell division protease FtsH